MRKIGKKNYIYDCGTMADVYMKISGDDEDAANLLFQANKYNQALYFLIQSMEKYIKGLVCRKINIMNEYLEEELYRTGHSLDASLDLLIEIMAENDMLLKEHLKKQIKDEILENVKYSKLYNAIRYPAYNRYRQNYAILEISLQDYQEVYNAFNILKKYLDDLIRM